MKSKLFTCLTNFVLILVVTAVSLVGFFSGNAAAVIYESENLYYGGKEEHSQVGLTFNVYEATNNVLKILDILDEYEAKATFFIGGSWADDNVSVLKTIRDKGHEIGTHGYFHRDHSTLNREQNIDEIRRSVEFIALAADVTVTLFAPPSGAFNDTVLDAAESMGLKTILWSKDTIDWRDKNKSDCYTRATKDVKGGDLILMHPMEHTLAALPEILSYYKQQGLRAITVSENIG